MQPRLKMSRQGLELLKSFEGLRLTAARLPDGRWTMGHGHTQYAREGAVITEADAEALLLYDLIPVTAAVNEAVTVEVSQRQFDALACFAFNVGVEAFRQSEVLTRVNQERMTEAALAMAIWRSGAFNGRPVVLDALVRRRSAEEALLLGGETAPAPSDLVRPEIDPAAQSALPAEEPAAIAIDFGSPQAEARLVGPPAEDAPALAPGAAPDAVGGIEAQAEQPRAEVEPEPAAVADAAEPAPAEPPIEEALTSASLSTRVFTSYPSEPFAPAATLEPGGEVDDSIPLNVPPDADLTVTAEASEPPMVLILTPPPEAPVEPLERPVAPETVEAPQATGQESLFDGPPSSQDGLIHYERPEEPEDKARRWSDTAAYLGSGAVGLVAFGAGIAGFQIAAQSPSGDGLFDEKSAIAWVLVLIGVVCVWISAYNLFKRLGGSED